MSYATVYTKSVKRRATGVVEVRGCVYETKSLTPMHEHIRSRHPDAQTWRDPSRITTDFMLGMNLGIRPLVNGGVFVAGAAA